MMWRTHSCDALMRAASRFFSTLGFEMLSIPKNTCRDESRHGTHECVRHRRSKPRTNSKGASLLKPLAAGFQLLAVQLDRSPP
jgi:hypothetical protein